MLGKGKGWVDDGERGGGVAGKVAFLKEQHVTSHAASKNELQSVSSKCCASPVLKSNFAIFSADVGQCCQPSNVVSIAA